MYASVLRYFKDVSISYRLIIKLPIKIIIIGGLVSMSSENNQSEYSHTSGGDDFNQA